MDNLCISKTYGVGNKENFKKLLSTKQLNLLRKQVCDFIIEGNEDSFYDIDDFNREYIKDIKKTLEMVHTVCEELHKIGWKTYLGRGDTALYIYSYDERPDNFY
jgi:hypothetical protein